LAQEGLDGKTQYSPIISLQNNDNTSVEISPNPVENGVFTLQLTASNASSYKVELVNLQGQMVENKEFSAEKGLNQIEYTLSNESKGCYFLKVFDEFGLVTTKKLLVY
jgi:hypothetical protein